MHIGLIGGIGPAATDYYYQNIIRAFEARNLELELTMVHARSTLLLQNLAENKEDEQVAIYLKLANRLKEAGAKCVVVTSIAGHFCINAFKKVSPLPIIDMVAETNLSIKNSGFSKVGILGTKTVMETRFYGAIERTEVLIPEKSILDDVHEAYVSMASAGRVDAHQRNIFDKACGALINHQGAEAIVLGGTDLALVYQEGSCQFPVIDCAAIHCRSVINFATGD